MKNKNIIEGISRQQGYSEEKIIKVLNVFFGTLKDTFPIINREKDSFINLFGLGRLMNIDRAVSVKEIKKIQE